MQASLLCATRRVALVLGDPNGISPKIALKALDALSASERGHITLCGWLADADVYCCGSPPTVAAVREATLAQGLAHADFHADVFVLAPSGDPSVELAEIATHLA